MAKPGVTSAPMKAARAVLRVLLRPWLAVQTQTNHEVARRLQRLSSEVSGLLRRTPDVEESLQQLEARLREIERRAASSSLPSPAQSGAADLRTDVRPHASRTSARARTGPSIDIVDGQRDCGVRVRGVPRRSGRGQHARRHARRLGGHHCRRRRIRCGDRAFRRPGWADRPRRDRTGGGTLLRRGGVICWAPGGLRRCPAPRHRGAACSNRASS